MTTTLIAPEDVVGIAADAKTLYTGYDQWIWDKGELHPDQEREIAVEMIRRWAKWGGLLVAGHMIGSDSGFTEVHLIAGRREAVTT